MQWCSIRVQYGRQMADEQYIHVEEKVTDKLQLAEI